MSDIGYNRCPNDDYKLGTAEIGVNPDTGKPIELNLNGVATVVAVQSALLTLGAALRNGHEPDFLEKVSLAVYGKLIEDPHALCPLLTICSMCLLMLRRGAAITFDKDGHVVIAPPGIPAEESGPICMYDDEEDEDYGTYEEPMDGTGGTPVGTGGDGSDGINP